MGTFAVIGLTCALLFTFNYYFASAAEMTGANPQCNPWFAQCPCKKCPNSKNKCTVSCKNTANCAPGICKAVVPGGTTNGICVAKGKCEGENFTDQKGEQQGVGDAKGMMEAMKGVMDMLKEAMKGGGGGGGGQQGQQQQAQSGQNCTQYYQVSVPTTDQCAYYVPPTSNQLLGSNLNTDTSQSLLDALSGGTGSGLESALGGETGSSGKSSGIGDVLSEEDATDDEGESEPLSVSEQLLGGLLGGKGKEGATSEGGKVSSTGKEVDVSGVSNTKAKTTSGTHGDIEVTDTGGTIYAGARDAETNTEVAGFYGSSGGVQPQGLVAQLCQNRPWADSVVAYVIPSSFFDGLCTWRGYQVGKPAPPSDPVSEVASETAKGTQTQTKTAPETGKKTPRVPAVPPEVDIWTVPPRVPLGSRTSVFWNAKGVDSCAITSPDGSFNESTLTGGAATVPLTGPTTFTISCLTEEGEPVTDYVIVNLTL